MLGPSSWTFGNNSGWTLISYKCLQQRFEIGRQKPGTCFVPSRELLDLVQPFSWTAAKESVGADVVETALQLAVLLVFALVAAGYVMKILGA
jgi:hypothetical protein